MPENISNSKLANIPQPESPVARSGAGDISERELSRERHCLQTTPPASRVQPVHPRKQLCSAPVNKFTAKSSAPSPNLDRIRSCLADYQAQTTPARPAKIGPKAVSMEDLTPNKRIRRERSELPVLRSPGLASQVEKAAAARIARFMVVAAWRRRRDELRCTRKTLEFQVGCSERLRIQVSTLKSLLDSDNAKVRLAMKELDRLKQLLRDKDLEKAVLEREKLALENDVCAAEDRASEMSIGWRNCRNELEGVRASAALSEHALSLERAASAAARDQRDHAYDRLSELEEELANHEELLSATEAEVAALRRERDEKQALLDSTIEQLKIEQAERARCSSECQQLNVQVQCGSLERSELRSSLQQLREELEQLRELLRATTEQLEWWPRPLTKMLGAARSLFKYPMTLPEAVFWSLIPSRHGC